MSAAGGINEGSTITLGGNSTFTLATGAESPLAGNGANISFAGGTLVYGTGTTADVSAYLNEASNDDKVKVNVGSNEVTWVNYSTIDRLVVDGNTDGKLILGRGSRSENNTLDELVINSGTVSIAYGTALKGVDANSNTIGTAITMNGGTLELQSPTATAGLYVNNNLGKTLFHLGQTLTLAPDEGKTISIIADGNYGLGLNNNSALTYDGSKGGGTATIFADVGGFGTSGSKTVTFQIGDSANTELELDVQGYIGNSNSTSNVDSHRTTLKKTGAGTMRIGNTNYLPKLEIVEGTVIAAHGSALGKTTANEDACVQTVTVGTNETAGVATLDIQADCSTVLLKGNSNGVITNSTDTMHLLVIGEQSTNTRASRFEGSITGKLGIRMINGNAGGIRNKLTLTGENTYTGATTLWNNAGIYLDGGSIGTATGNNEVDVYEGAEFQISNGGYVQNTGAMITNVQGQTADMQAVALTASGIDLKKSEGNDRAQGAIRNTDITVSGNKYRVANVALTDSNVTVASGKTLAIGDNVSASGLSLSTASGATEAAKLTSDSTGHMAIASGDTLKVKDMEISNIAFATETGRSTIDITAGELLKGSVQADASETAPTSTTALLKDCSLKNSDVVISAVGATEAFAAANGTDGHLLGTPYTLDIMSGVKLLAGDSFSLELKGLENYTNVKLYWSSTGLVTGGDLDGTTDLAGTVNLDNNSIGSMAYNGGQVLFENGVSGHVVNVWATYNIPEPTTGVLSVLALAGLAARRRRKN